MVHQRTGQAGKGMLPMVLATACCFHSIAGTISGSFTPVAAGSNVNLTTLGKLDWIQWGLGGDYKANRKAGVTPLISNFTLISHSANSFSSPYWFEALDS